MTAALPLAGVRVLDLSGLLPGPYASRVLLDMGASVDKLEAPGGDQARAMPPLFAALNAGKRSLVLDLKSAEGRATFLRILPRYDVLIEQFRPGVMARLGVSHAVMQAAHPRLVVCAITGFGQTGELALRAGHDLTYLARAGVLGAQGPLGGVPATPGVQVADVGGAQAAALAIVGALFARSEADAAGEPFVGPVLDISLTESAVPFAIAQLLVASLFPRGDAPLAGGLSVYNCYATKDGRYVAFAALEAKFWRAFAAGVGIEADDSPTLPGAHQAAWKERLTAIFASRTQAEWTAFGAAHDCCLEPILDPNDETAASSRWSKDQMNNAGVPALGQHTDEILREAHPTSRRLAPP